MQTLTLKQYGIEISYHNIPDNVARLSLRYNRPPVGECYCGRMGYLNYMKHYVCDRCAKIERGAKVGDKAAVDIYMLAGSNLHRQTGRYIQPSAMDEYHYDLPPNLSAALSD